MALEAVKQFRIFADPYYWKSAFLIGSCGIAKKYHSSYLGSFWLLLPWILNMIVYLIIMPMIMKIDARSYALYLLSTFPLWQFIAVSISSSTNSLIDNAETLKRCIISSSVFPVADIIKNTYSYFVAFIGMALIAMMFGLSFSWHIFLFPIYFIPIMMSVMSLCVGISYITPFVRDLKYAIEMIMSILVWASAILYPITVLPEHIQKIVSWSPIYILFEPIINIIYLQQIPSLLVTTKLLGLMILCITTGYIFYKIGRKNFVYYL